MAPYRADQILVKPKPGTSPAALESFHAKLGATVKRTFRSGGTQLVTVPSNETALDLVAKYQQSGLVEFAEPDFTVYPDVTLPDDPAFTNGTLWGLNNYGQNWRHPRRGH